MWGFGFREEMTQGILNASSNACVDMMCTTSRDMHSNYVINCVYIGVIIIITILTTIISIAVMSRSQ